MKTSLLHEVESPSIKRSPTSWRAIILGAFLAIGNILWTLYIEEIRGDIRPSTYNYFSTVLFILFWLVLINMLVRRRRPQLAFSTGELLTVFCMMSVAGAMASCMLVPVLVQLITEGTRQVTAAQYQSTLTIEYLPNWLIVNDPTLVKTYFLGKSSLFLDNHLQPFIGPFFWWAGFIVLFLATTFGANTILRRQWSRNEHLTFPVTQLPIAMSTQGSGSLFRVRLFWMGFAIAAAIDIMNGLNLIWPTIPTVPVKELYNLTNLTSNQMWSDAVFRNQVITISPYIIGIAFLIPLDLLFSFWFFFWVWKLERLYGFMQAIPVSDWSVNKGFPYYAHQMIGVWLAMLTIIIWTARRHLRGVLRQAWKPGSGADDSDEPISYRLAVIGVLVGMTGMATFLTTSGVSPYMSIPWVVLLLGVMIILARIRAELGPPIQDINAAGPDRALYTFISPMSIGARSWVSFNILTFWLHHFSYLAYPSANHMDALKIAEVGKGLNRRFWFATAAIAVVGALVAFWFTLYMGFKAGPTKGVNYISGCYAFCVWRGVSGTFQDATARPDWGEVSGMVVGYGFTMGLFFLRSLAVNIPLHPIAYLLTGGGSLGYYWFPIFLAWLIKWGTLRYGGLRLYNTLLPFFFGLILGEFVIGLIWSIIGSIFGIRTYSFA